MWLVFVIHMFLFEAAIDAQFYGGHDGRSTRYESGSLPIL